MPTLLLSVNQDHNTQAMWRTAIQRGWRTHRVIEDVPPVQGGQYYYYGNTLDPQRFKLAVPTNFLRPQWLAELPLSLTSRRIQCMTAAEARKITTPAFIKCVETKWMPAAVRTGADIPQEIFDKDTLLVSEVVTWDKEYRCFVKDNVIVTMSQYRVRGELDVAPVEVADFPAVDMVLEASKTLTNRGVVIDIGTLDNGKYAIIEANECWASGLYACDPVAALDTIIAEQTVS